MGVIKINGKIYGGSSLSASNIMYNGVTSGLEASTVQAAIDGLFNLSKDTLEDVYNQININKTNITALTEAASNLLNIIYPINSTYNNTTNTNPSTFLGGTWTCIKKRCIDTGWQDYSWKNTTYIGTSQSSYNQNKWRIKDNVLYVECGMGATSTINTGDELEIARVPVKGGHATGTGNRIWTGAVGGSGAVSGFMLLCGASYWSIHAKPHTSANNHAAPWYSACFAVALNDNFTFNTGSYVWEYTWRRTA